MVLKTIYFMVFYSIIYKFLNIFFFIITEIYRLTALTNKYFSKWSLLRFTYYIFVKEVEKIATRLENHVLMGISCRLVFCDFSSCISNSFLTMATLDPFGLKIFCYAVHKDIDAEFNKYS